jgi:hypothetical protein
MGSLILDCRVRLAYGEHIGLLPVIGLIGWGLDASLRQLAAGASGT